MSRVKENIKIKYKGKTIEVFHDGIKPFKDWTEESKKLLDEWVKESIEKGKEKNWLPFANFESSVQFNIKKSES